MAYQKVVIHRDLSRQNIFLDFDGVPKIGDFGLAVFLEDGQDDISCSPVGKRNYLAPEVHEVSDGKNVTVTRASHMYSFTLVIMEMLHAVDMAMEREKLFRALREGKFPQDPDSNIIAEAVCGLLTPEPSLRQSAEQVLHGVYGS